MPETANLPPEATPAAPHAAGRLLTILRRVPFTAAALFLILIIGIATGSLWVPLSERSWFEDVGYGLPSLTDGAWWTPVTGSFLALSPAFYLPVLLSFGVFVGFTEWRLGTARTALICVGGQLAAVLAASGTLVVLRFNSWAWAEQLETARDAGFSAGALACITPVATAVMRPPWRLRIRAVLCVYVLVSFLFLGSLADLEHLWAVALALPLGRHLVGAHAVDGAGGRRTLSRRRLAAGGGDRSGAARGGRGGAAALLDARSARGARRRQGVRGRRRPRRRGDRADHRRPPEGTPVGVVVRGGARRAERRRRRRHRVPLPVGGGRYGHRGSERCPLVRRTGDPGGRTARVPGAVAGRRRLGRRMRAERTDQEVVRDLLVRHGGGNLSWMATWPDRSYFRTPDGESVVAYERHAGVAIAIGDPIGPPERRGAAVSAFAAMCEHNGSVPCFFSVPADTAALAGTLGWQHVRVADDTVIDLDGAGVPGQEVAGRPVGAQPRGQGGDLLPAGHAGRGAVGPWRAQARAISQQWVGDKGLPEMGFTLGGIDEAMDPARRAWGWPSTVTAASTGSHRVAAGVRSGRRRARVDARRDPPPQRRLPAGVGVPDRLGLPGVPGPGRRVRVPVGRPAGTRRHVRAPTCRRTAARLPGGRDGAALRLPVAARLRGRLEPGTSRCIWPTATTGTCPASGSP